MTEEKKEQDKIIWWGMITGSLVWLFMVAAFAISLRKLPPELPLFYSLPRGEEQLIGKFWFLGVLIAGGVAFFINFILALKFGKEEALLRRFLVWGGVSFLILLMLTTVRVVLIVL